MNISEIENNHYDNVTRDESVDVPRTLTSLQAQHVVAVVIYTVVFVVGLPGNLLVLWVTGSQVRRSMNAIWFLNLAVADLLSCLTLPIIIATIIHSKWLLGRMACRILIVLFHLDLYASVLLLATISIDRFLMVVKPIWGQNYRVPWLAWLASGVVWILALVLSIPYFVFRVFFEDSLSKKPFCFLTLWIYGDQVEIAVTVTRFVLTFLAPLVTMLVCYSFLLLRTWRRPATRSTKTLKVVVAVVTSFFILWLPYHICEMLFVFLPRVSSPIRKLFICLCMIAMALASVNWCINPFIYVAAARGLHFRVFKLWPGRLRQLLMEDWDTEGNSRPMSTVDSEVPNSQTQV